MTLASPCLCKGRAHRRHIQIISASGGGGRPRCALLSQLLMRSILSHSFLILAASLSGVYFLFYWNTLYYTPRLNCYLNKRLI